MGSEREERVVVKSAGLDGLRTGIYVHAWMGDWGTGGWSDL